MSLIPDVPALFLKGNYKNFRNKRNCEHESMYECVCVDMYVGRLEGVLFLMGWTSQMTLHVCWLLHSAQGPDYCTYWELKQNPSKFLCHLPAEIQAWQAGMPSSTLQLSSSAASQCHLSPFLKKSSNQIKACSLNRHWEPPILNTCPRSLVPYLLTPILNPNTESWSEAGF